MVFLLLAVLATTATPLSIEEYVTMPAIGSVAFSPDGSRIAYVLTRGSVSANSYDSDVWLIGADGRNGFQLTRGPRADYAPQWSPDGRTLAFLSNRDRSTAIYLISPTGGEAERLVEERTPVRSFRWSPDGKSIAFLRLDDRPDEQDDIRIIGEGARHVHLHVVDLETREIRRVTTGEFTIFDYAWSPDAKTIAFASGPGSGLDDEYRTDLYLVDAAGGDPRPLVVRPGLERRPQFSPDGRSIAFTSTRGVHDWLREHFLHVLNLSDGTIRVVSPDYGRTPTSFMWSADGKSLWFEGPLNTTNQIFRVGADGSRFTNVTNAPGMVTDPDIDFPRNRVAFVYQTLTSPPEVYISSTTRFEPRRLTNHNAAYRDRVLGDTRLIRWTNPKDGLEIEGLLTLPVGYVAGRKYPLLTFVHGGPASRFDQAFLGYLGYIYPPHVFAAQGYAILRPNPRGTGGYGEAFRQANRNDWGGMDWIDINSGIDSVIAQGIADPERLGLMGWSYGGFMAAWAISQSERLKAISVGAPVVDLLSFHGTADIRDFIPFYFPAPEAAQTDAPQLEAMKRARMSLDELREHSPLWQLRPTDVPVLIQHGESDLRVPLSQGMMLYRMLDDLGANVAMVVYPRTAHTPREPRLRLDVARRNVEFFGKHIPATSSPASLPSSPDR